MELKPGDTYNVTRDGKVFLTQYSALSAHVSLTRTLGDDPEAERIEMEALADRLWHEAALANHRLVSDAYAAMGKDSDVEQLIEYLERKSRGDVEATPEVVSPVSGAGKIVKRKRRL